MEVLTVMRVSKRGGRSDDGGAGGVREKMDGGEKKQSGKKGWEGRTGAGGETV